jgi:hypothetical protein
MDKPEVINMCDEGGNELLRLRLCKRCRVMYWTVGDAVMRDEPEAVLLAELAGHIRRQKLGNMGASRN